jgi:hypothetical protein
MCIAALFGIAKIRSRPRAQQLMSKEYVIKAQYIQNQSTKEKPPWTFDTHLIFKNEGQEGKINLFQGWVSVGGGEHKKRGNESVYGGCVLYPYMKIEE